MKISKTKLVLLFLMFGFAFLFFYNVFILSVVRLIPESGATFFGTTSLTGWKSTVATLLYPVKIILAGPVLPLINLPDPPPPFLMIAFTIYWNILALLIHYLISKLSAREQR